MTKTTQTFNHFSLYTVFLFFLHLHFFSHANSQLNDQEQTILLKLNRHWENPPVLSHWSRLNSSHYCDWPEITCTNGSLTELRLPNKNITGTFPPFVCDLKNLTLFDLSNNNIFNEFPKALYNCSKLEDLDLSQNYFNGTIPLDIHRLSRLRRLNLGANSFSGNIPTSIGQLKELRKLQLFSCPFSGSFPPEIGNLYNLERLELAYNVNMTAAVLPSSFTKLKKLTYLWMAGSNLNGEIPDAIGEMEALVHLDLSRNNLSGKIPSSLFMPKNLSIVYLYKNQLSGEIPRVVKALNIDVIDLSENKLTGTIPDDFGRLRNMSGLSMFLNQLSGKVPDSIGRLPKLITLKLFSNNLSGTLPPDFGRYSILEDFQVSANKLTGNLPEHLCGYGRMVGVVAFDNDLTGELPKSLGNCSGLRMVSVYNNRFTGNIPSGLWTSSSLSFLMISNNSFMGELPQSVAANLSRLQMSNNNFSGKIPTGVSFWKNLVVFEASNNLFTGTIPQELTALAHLTTLLLDQNQLSGSLPSNIISWKSLNTLNLSRNKISGHIPEKLAYLATLTELDLSENQLSGQIPPQLGLLKLTSLNLSSNHLTGKIPTQFENNAYARSFLNNPTLCASKSSLNIDICNSEPLKSSKIPPIYLALIIGLVMAVVVCLLATCLVIRIYKKKKQVLDSTWRLTSFHTLNFTESEILSGLTENNLIGSGGSGKVYRVVVNHSRDTVAVKRIWNSQKLEEKLEKEFLAEVENTKFNSTFQHNSNWGCPGALYMHNDCVPPIVHRDVKSSNILLDSEFNAKIADFGLAKMLINKREGELTTMSTVAGSFGYIAPEYAHTTRVNEKIDVYSFGVILLELTTGRKANDGDEHTSLAQWAWRHIQEGNPIVDALDEAVKEPDYLDEMSCVFNLGIICTNTQPLKRPSMKEVLQILLKCSQPLICGGKNTASFYDV
uniref:Protein kinase domain-containing protein n=1 Tax=Fagus sylvatica TaxID=28930 RepID=A0A2N9HS67_FAGSY